MLAWIVSSERGWSGRRGDCLVGGCSAFGSVCSTPLFLAGIMKAEFRNPNLWDWDACPLWLIPVVGIICMVFVFVFGWLCSRNAERWLRLHGRRSSREVQWSEEALERCKDVGEEG